MTNVKLMVSGKTGPAVSHNFGDTFDTTQEFSRVLFNNVPSDATIGELMAEVGVSGSSIIAGTSTTTRDATVGSLADGPLLKISISGSAKADGNSDEDEDSEQEPLVDGGFLNPLNIQEQIYLYFRKYARKNMDEGVTELIEAIKSQFNKHPHDTINKYSVKVKIKKDVDIEFKGVVSIPDIVNALASRRPYSGSLTIDSVFINGVKSSNGSFVKPEDHIEIIYK